MTPQERQYGLYPGSFDTPTNGHLNIIRRASRLFPRLCVAVANNSAKSPLLTVEERVLLLRQITEDIRNVSITAFEGLTVAYARRNGMTAIVRGLRAVTDFEYELQMALTNQQLAPDIETVYFAPALETSFMSSSTVREILHLGGDISPFVPPQVEAFLREKISKGDLHV